MLRKLDQWTTALTVMALVGALLACKKKDADTTAPSATAVASAAPVVASAAVPAASASAAVAVAAPALGDVKRYADKEKVETGSARITEDTVKVYDEADDKTAEVATLDKDLLVFRLASIPDWELVEFPSGVGKVSPGWVLAKFVDTKTTTTVAREAVATQTKIATVTTTAKSATTATTAAPKASATAAASAAKPVTTANAAAAAAAANAAAATNALAAANKALAADPTNKAAQIAVRAATRAKAAADKSASSSKP